MIIKDYFVVIRWSYLPLWRDEHFIVEPYNPHQFSRQFGYYKEISGVLTYDIRKATLDDEIPYWQLYTLSKSISKVRLPSIPPDVKKFSLEDYKKNIESLINSKPDALMEGEKHDKEGDPFDKEASGKKILDIEDDDELQDNQRSTIGQNLLDIVTPNAKTQEELLKVLFDKANAYDKTRSIPSEKAYKELLTQQLGIAKDRLHNTLVREVKKTNQIQSTKEELESIKRELENLKERKKNLCASLERQQLLQSTQAKVHEIEEEIITIENDLPSSNEAIENLKTGAAHSEAMKEELKSLDFFA
ncbi:hypothetical protein CDL12_23463 [Handroanthus impetiginosus]|uniref:Uncharacterized protein n=1 Tax=Handroanthus impetiginosus TaxID=429701 RepID=A0A2G9GFD8_9LAMI|nr:hypothetical protein CDL12_23463 [Handroanthus impetiginosus]